MSNPNLLTPVADTPFEPIVNRITWESGGGAFKPHLRVAHELGCLVTVAEPEPTDNETLTGLVGFSTENILAQMYYPPSGPKEAMERNLKPTKLPILGEVPIDSARMAKGLCEKMSNTPQAVDPRAADLLSGLAMRRVALHDMADIYRRDQAERLGPVGQWLRHGLMVLRAGAVDRCSDYYSGTLAAIRRQERPYGYAPLVLMDAPPSWQHAQKKNGIEQPVSPKAVLVRGGEYHVDRNLMTTLGHHPVIRGTR